MDGSDEYTTFDDSASDPSYVLPQAACTTPRAVQKFIPEPVPQMQVGNSSDNEPASPILSATSSRCNNRDKRRKGQCDTIENAQQALVDQSNRSVPPNDDNNDEGDDDEVIPLPTKRCKYKRKKPSLL